MLNNNNNTRARRGQKTVVRLLARPDVPYLTAVREGVRRRRDAHFVRLAEVMIRSLVLHRNPAAERGDSLFLASLTASVDILEEMRRGARPSSSSSSAFSARAPFACFDLAETLLDLTWHLLTARVTRGVALSAPPPLPGPRHFEEAVLSDVDVDGLCGAEVEHITSDGTSRAIVSVPSPHIPLPFTSMEVSCADLQQTGCDEPPYSSSLLSSLPIFVIEDEDGIRPSAVASRMRQTWGPRDAVVAELESSDHGGRPRSFVARVVPQR